MENEKAMAPFFQQLEIWATSTSQELGRTREEIKVSVEYPAGYEHEPYLFKTPDSRVFRTSRWSEKKKGDYVELDTGEFIQDLPEGSICAGDHFEESWGWHLAEKDPDEASMYRRGTFNSLSQEYLQSLAIRDFVDLVLAQRQEIESWMLERAERDRSKGSREPQTDWSLFLKTFAPMFYTKHDDGRWEKGIDYPSWGPLSSELSLALDVLSGNFGIRAYAY